MAVLQDPIATAKIVTWDTNQWIGWDGPDTLKLKVKYISQMARAHATYCMTGH